MRSQKQFDAGLKGGEGFQQIMGISYAPSNPDIVYFVTDSSQVWKSKNGGDNWEMKHNGFYALGGLSVVVDPNDEETVFVAGSIVRKITYPKDIESVSGIFRTTDGGENWELVEEVDYFGKSTGQKHQGQHFSFDPSSVDSTDGRTKVIYAGTYKNGLLKSEDGGDTWDVVAEMEEHEIYDVKVNPHETSEVYVASNKGLFRYDANDSEIHTIGYGLPEIKDEDYVPDYPRNIAIHPNDPDIIYVAVGKKGIYRSENGGKNFSGINQGLDLSTYSPDDPNPKEYIYISISPVPDISISPAPEEKRYRLYASCYRDQLNPFYWDYWDDVEEKWKTPETLNKDGYALSDTRWFAGMITPHPTDAKVALAAANGKTRVIKTVDGGVNWSYSNEGFTGGLKGPGKASVAFGTDPQQYIFFLIDHGPFLTNDDGEIFTSLNVPKTLNSYTTHVGALSPDGGTIVTAVGGWFEQTLTVGHYVDEYETWDWETISTVTLENNEIVSTDDDYHFIGFDPQEPNVVYAQQWRSTDTGRSWEKLSRKVIAVYPNRDDDPGRNGIVYSSEIENVEIENNKRACRTVIYKSVDKGMSWCPYKNLPVKNVYEIAVDPINPDHIYAATWKGVYILREGEWIHRADKNGLEEDLYGEGAVQSIAIDPRCPDIIYAGKWSATMGHSNGIFRSTDAGENWENITYNLGPDINIWSISISPYTGEVYIGTYSGTWVLSPPTIDGNDNYCDGQTDEGLYIGLSDGDGTPDCNDNCPDDPLKTEPGACGCGKKDVDSDCDGYFNQAGCGTEVDCDDSDASVNPDATEICDNKDNNCNDKIDEVCGNVDSDDCIGMDDVSCLYQWVIGNTDNCLKDVDVPSCNSCDVNGNGAVDIMDVLCLHRRILDNSSCLDSANLSLCIP